MSRKIRDRKLDSASARAKLKASPKPYWRALGRNLHLGYRKGQTGGSWVERHYLGSEQYKHQTFAEADDHVPADGNRVLNYYQAQDRCRELYAQAGTQALSRALPQAVPFTVSMALDAYFISCDEGGSKSVADARGRADKHITPALGNVLVADLTREGLAKWLAGVAASKQRLGPAKKGRAAGDAVRAGKATADRTLAILRAALNYAFRDGKVPSDVAWRSLRPFRDTGAPRLRYFTREECLRLINAAQGSFRPLLQAALFSGCRYGELCRLRAGDFDIDSGTIFVAETKSGKSRHVVLTDEARRFFSALTAGRPADALMLARDSGGSWGPSNAIVRMTQTMAAARVTGGSFHSLRHTAASLAIMGGVPLHVVARNLGHSDTRMVEKHYGHMSQSYITDAIRRFTPDFGAPEDAAVVPLRRG